MLVHFSIWFEKSEPLWSEEYLHLSDRKDMYSYYQ